MTPVGMSVSARRYSASRAELARIQRSISKSALATSHHQHDAAVDRSGLEVGEHLVDIFQLRFVDFRAHLALGGECDCFGEVFTAAYDRAADCNSIHDNVENGRLEVFGREANQAHRALAPHQL